MGRITCAAKAGCRGVKSAAAWSRDARCSAQPPQWRRHRRSPRNAVLERPNTCKARGFGWAGSGELDAAYDQSVYAPCGGRAICQHKPTGARTPWRGATPCPRSQRTRMARHLPHRRPNAPIFVYFHGGPWLRGSAADNGFPAEMFVNAGAHFVVLDFIAISAATR